ncbi:MAG TPA: SPOR domain-containing protein [Sphingomonas sp.]|nr:SPOR domain-containing protein [Sphingomonas sp.]
MIAATHEGSFGTMGITWRTALGASVLALAAASAAWGQANPVKDGVDAWSRGDYRTAVGDWQGPAAQGDADAEFNLGQAYRLGRGVTADPAKAQDWYRKAAEQGHFQAEDNYGRMLFQSGHLAEAVPWLEKSVSRGDPRAQLILGTMLFNGDGGLKKDWPRAYALMVRAASTGLPQATQTLADMDRYIPEAQRKQGLVLARQYETDAHHAQLPPEVTAGTRIKTAPVPPSKVAAAGTSYAAPGSKAPPPAKPASKPAAKPALQPAAPAAKPASGKWRIQLGAFSTEARARSLWTSLSPKVAALNHASPDLVHAGSIVRLQVAGFASSAEAARACAEVKRAGGQCLTVAP